jgi:hypothetical protein
MLASMYNAGMTLRMLTMQRPTRFQAEGRFSLRHAGIV